MRDWAAWHSSYDDPSSALSARLERVRFHLANAIDRAPRGPVRLVSLCAGQGHDVLWVLPGHPRRDDVSAVLVESDPRNASLARQRAAEASLCKVEVREVDASRISNFADALPADVLLLCGIFGNVSHGDIRRTVSASARMCADNATVIWTRHRRPPDLTEYIRAWFADAGFDEVAFDALENKALTGVGVHQLRARATGMAPVGEGALFTFSEQQR